MLNKIMNLIEYNIMIVLSLFLLIALIIDKVSIITSILICAMWFMFGFLSFQKGFAAKLDDELTEMYRQKIIEDYNKEQDDISNN